MFFRSMMVPIAGALVVATTLLYLGDALVLHVRTTRGTAFRTMQVHQLLASPLKGQKEEFDYLGDVATMCSRSLFPQAGNPPCWWLSGHMNRWQ